MPSAHFPRRRGGMIDSLVLPVIGRVTRLGHE
jgi:hypothetical protein